MREPRHLSVFLPNVRVLRRLEEEIQKSRHANNSGTHNNFCPTKNTASEPCTTKQKH